MNRSWIVCCMLLLTGTVSFTNGETTKEIATSTVGYNSNNNNQDYPISYDDYQDPDYPVPDYYGEEREGRTLGNEIPDPASDENYLRQLESTIPGIPGVDYPMYQSVPDTSFRCDNQKSSAGFFGDVEAQCQVFHICQEDGRHDSFLCPIGTVFNQMNLICDWWFNFKCDDTPSFFRMNADLQRPPRMQDAMKKMRRFRETDSSSMPESKEVDRVRRKMVMSDMDRSRILNLFSPKMRSGNIWERLRTNEKVEDGTSKASTSNSEDLRSFGSTDIFDYTTSDFLTTLLTTTDSTPHTSEKGYSKLPSELTAVDLSTNVNHNISLQSIQLFDSIKINSTEINDKELNANGINATFAIPTSNENGTTFTPENVTFDESSSHAKGNRLVSSFDGSEDIQTDTYTSIPQDRYYNHTSETLSEISMHSKQLDNSIERSTPHPLLNISSKLELSGKPTANRNSSLALGNDTHITVSVTIRAGISRLKWKRLPEVRKNMKLKTDPGISGNDSENDSPMDLVFRRRKMRNRPNTRIMWIPAKTDTLKRKSIWKILVNSKPSNGGSRNASRLLYNLMDLDKNAFEPMQINNVVEKIYVDPNVSQGNSLQEDDVQSTTLQSDNTEMAFSFMRPSEIDLFNSTSPSKIIFDEPIALALTDIRIPNNEDNFQNNELVNSEYNKGSNETEIYKEEDPFDKQSGDFATIERGQEKEKFETTTATNESEGCRKICIKLLQSIGSLNDNADDVISHPVSTLRQIETLNEYIPHIEEQNLKAQFSRRSFLGVPPTEQWSVKYDPDPKCNEDIEEGKALLKGWSIIVDAGSVTKEKTVKRRGCDNLFNDSKIIVMKSLRPQQTNIPGRGKSKTNFPHGDNDSKINFGATDQQYWLSLVRNWLDAAPNSKLKSRPASYKNTDDQHQQKRFPPVERNKYDKNDSPISKQFNMRNSKSDSNMNENRRHNWQNNLNKKISKNGFNQGSISRRNSGSNAGSKWVWSKEQDSDVISSQSNREEWHVDAENKMDSIRDSLSDYWNDQKATSSKDLAQRWTQNSMHSVMAFPPRNGASDWSLEDNKNAFPKTRNRDVSSGDQTDNLHPSSYQQNNENGSDEDDTKSQQDFRSGNLRGKRDWESQQRNRNRPNLSIGASSGISEGDDQGKIPWSSDYFNDDPSRSRNDNYEGTLKTNNRDQWSDNIGTKTSPSDDLYKMSWSSGNKGSATTDRRRGSSGTNIKSNGSTKTADPDLSSKSNTNQKGRPSIKGGGFDSRIPGNKPNRDGRRIPEDLDSKSKENRPFPGQTDEMGWGSGDSKTSSRPQSSSSSNKGNAWSSRDEQQGSDWSSDNRKDEEWSSEDQQRKTDRVPDRKIDQAWSSKDQQGKDDWASDSKKDNAWSSDDQQGITDWPSDIKNDNAWSSKDQQGKNDWASDNKGDQSWSSGDQQAKAGAWPDSKKDQSQKGRDWPSGNQKGRTWSPGDQQEKSDWPSSSKMNKDWSSRDQQEKTDTSNKKDSSKWPDSSSNRKEFPTQNKGSSSPPLSNGEDNIPRSNKGTSRDTSQKDISQSAFNENDDWSTKQNVKRPVWSSDENDDAFNAKKNDDDWFLDNKKEESGSIDASLNVTNKGNSRPNSRVHMDRDYGKNIPDRSSGRSWNADSSVDNSNGWSSDSSNRNIPGKQSTSMKGDNTRSSSFPVNGDTRRTTNSKGGRDSGFKTSMENIPSDSNSAWTKDSSFDPPLSKGGSSDDSLQNSKARRTDNRNKGLPRNPSSLPSSWSDGKDSLYSNGPKGQNRQSDWSNDDKSIATYMPNRRDEMKLDWWWDADEELGPSSNGPKQDAPSWSGTMNDDGWSSDIKPEWSSEPDENKMPVKNKGDWSLNTRENRRSKKNDEDWPSNKRSDWSSQPTGKRMSKANDNRSSKRNPDWPTQTSRTPTSKVNRGSSSGWDQRPYGGQGAKGPSTDGPWKSKGSTKTATPSSKDWNDPSKTKPGKPWKDEETVPQTVNNMKGEDGMKEEKIVWSPQISSNGELGNGWVPITLRPNTKKPTNQTQDNNKGASKSSGDWSGVKQQMDGWDNEDLTQNTPIPQYMMDLITENVPPSSQIPDASIGHPFYIPLVNRRSKRANRLISLTKKYIRPKAARRIYKVTNSSKEIGSIKTDENHRFYLASANILVGDDTTKHENKTNNSNAEESIRRLFKYQKRLNETIKNSIPSLNRLKLLRNNLPRRNLTFNYVKNLTELESENAIQSNAPSSFNLSYGNSTRINLEASKAYQKTENLSSENINQKDFGKDRIWDSLMEESETKELWSSPFDSSNVPESGWIPLFKVNKSSKNIAPSPIILENQNNLTEFGDLKNHVVNAKDLEQIESVVFLDSAKDNSEKEYGTLPNDTFDNSSTAEQLSEIGFEHRLTHNFTIDIDADEFAMNSEHELKDGNKTLRIIPFSNIMKQLRRNESSNDEIETTSSNTDEWNIAITATPKMYNLKMVNDSAMQSGNIGSSWTFHKGKPKGSPSWVLVKNEDAQNSTVQLKNDTSEDNRHKYDKSSHKNSTLYRLIVGNRTRQVDLSELNHKTEEAHSKPKSEDPASAGFSFDLKNWHKDSGWTPLIRAIGSVTTRKVDHGKIQSIS